ncbi:hypothetical protein IMZ17_16980 [Geobacillus stearothermophilus]|nr:hypothetical protein IMZ17_16980 [Geobacillus stearothermophilus]
MMKIDELKALLQNKYREFFQSIENISRDDQNNESLCSSPFVCLAFDNAVQDLASKKGEDALKSPDLLHIQDNQLLFVEFKNGKIDKKERQSLRLKAIEGPFIGLYEMIKEHDPSISFHDIVKIDKVYYVVYNEEKNPQKRTAGLQRHLEGQQIRFSLKKYKGTFMKDVKTICATVFLESVVSKWK